MKLPAVLYADLVGKPFRDQARGPSEYDCWGVVQVVLRRMGHAPTDFPSDPSLLMQAIADEWQPLDAHEAKPADGVLLRSINPKYEWHVGLMVDSFRFLHAHERAGVCVERIDAPAYRRRVVGFYRFRGRPA